MFPEIEGLLPYRPEPSEPPFEAGSDLSSTPERKEHDILKDCLEILKEHGWHTTTREQALSLIANGTADDSVEYMAFGRILLPDKELWMTKRKISKINSLIDLAVPKQLTDLVGKDAVDSQVFKIQKWIELEDDDEDVLTSIKDEAYIDRGVRHFYPVNMRDDGLMTILRSHPFQSAVNAWKEKNKNKETERQERLAEERKKGALLLPPRAKETSQKSSPPRDKEILSPEEIEQLISDSNDDMLEAG